MTIDVCCGIVYANSRAPLVCVYFYIYVNVYMRKYVYLLLSGSSNRVLCVRHKYMWTYVCVCICAENWRVCVVDGRVFQPNGTLMSTRTRAADFSTRPVGRIPRGRAGSRPIDTRITSPAVPHTAWRTTVPLRSKNTHTHTRTYAYTRAHRTHARTHTHTRSRRDSQYIVVIIIIIYYINIIIILWYNIIPRL